MGCDIANYRTVEALLGTGPSDYKIAQQTGGTPGTVRNWRCASDPPLTIERQELARTWSVTDGASYAYVRCSGG
jgi:hypothetical protein